MIKQVKEEERNFSYNPEKTAYYLKDISNYQDILENKIRTYKDLINDLFVKEVGYDIEYSITNWINEWKKVVSHGVLKREVDDFIEELTDMLLQCKDNLISDLFRQLECKNKALPSGEE